MMVTKLRLRELREGKGWTQMDLAAKFPKPIDQGRISKWENGAELPRAGTLVELARILGCGVGDLIMPVG